MVVPGMSSARIPMQARLLVALALSLALAPLVPRPQDIPRPDSSIYAYYIFSEVTVGGAFGLVGRFFIAALETMGAAIAMSLGISGNLGMPVEGDDAVPALAGLLTLAATAMLFAADLHYEIIRGITDTYTVFPLGGIRMAVVLSSLLDTLSAAFLACLRLASPFIAFGFMVNVAAGLLNRLVQQVPIYFIAVPLSVAGGLALLHFWGGDALLLFVRALEEGLRL